MQQEKYLIESEGFAVIEHVYSEQEIKQIIHVIETLDSAASTFRKSKDLFAIRQFFKEAPAAYKLIFSSKLNNLINDLFGHGYFITKSIYFDKPEESNWFVAYHQDLTIAVDQRVEVEGYESWTIKRDQFAVQPPISLLQKNFTIRVHLDDTDEHNGALKVVAKSHKEGVYRPETVDWTKEKEVSCSVGKGGIMIMKPLLLHASSRTTNNKQRRVVHIEFSNQELPEGLSWSERLRL